MKVPDAKLNRRNVRSRLKFGAVGLSAAATALFPYAPLAATATSRPPCQSLGFSPAFELDQTGYCVGMILTAEQVPSWGVFRTNDGGRSWVQTGDIPYAEGDVLSSVIVSPLYDTDHALFVQVGVGLYRSTDEGESFSLIPRAGPGPQGENLAPFVSTNALVPGLPAGEPRTMFALAGGDSSQKIDPPLSVPVAGSPDRDERFLLPDSFTADGNALMLAVEVDDSGEQTQSRSILYSCDITLTCANRLWEFPWGYQTQPGGGIWLTPNFGESKTIFVIQSSVLTEEDVVAWRSDDGGASFQPWTSVNDIASQIEIYEGSPRLSLAMGEAFPNRLYLRVRFSVRDEAAKKSPPAPPTEQIFRSDDLGAIWKRVAFGTSVFQHGANTRAKHRLPWTSGFGSLVGSKQFLLEPDGRLFLLGSVNSRNHGVYCSVDGGRRWFTLCPAN